MMIPPQRRALRGPFELFYGGNNSPVNGDMRPVFCPYLFLGKTNVMR
jgi:hypothetical protein